ncbi:hypothetical protein EJ06DRAFT_10785 [Trichodelitschia bisporula]|uniref:Uncharacterized protein n=1 Tax=Trichodelitschia bisporula TaxID=703511 RepID=A0A6G1I9R9_9PEZI|nr:hypothetical protein EJ06DRAFT_10785 [Trichodelitschia bisporula]
MGHRSKQTSLAHLGPLPNSPKGCTTTFLHSSTPSLPVLLSHRITARPLTSSLSPSKFHCPHNFLTSNNPSSPSDSPCSRLSAHNPSTVAPPKGTRSTTHTTPRTTALTPIHKRVPASWRQHS